MKRLWRFYGISRRTHMDRVNHAIRSRNMSRIRSRGNLTTEKRLRAYLVRSGITGWQLHCSLLAGNPDFVFSEIRLAVFVDGCFWHGCPKCGHTPKSNRRYWAQKLKRNQNRDKKVSWELRRIGWHVLRLWEHEVRLDPASAISRISAIARQH